MVGWMATKELDGMSEDGHCVLWSIIPKFTCRGWGEVSENKLVPVRFVCSLSFLKWRQSPSSQLSLLHWWSTENNSYWSLNFLSSGGSCPVLSCPILSCPTLSCPVLSWPALPCPALPCPVLSCPALPSPVLPCPILSWPALPCPVLSCPVLSCPVLTCPSLLCPFFLFFAAVSHCTSSNCLT